MSRLENSLVAVEQFADVEREYPYRYCFNNKGQVMAFQEMKN